MNLYSTDSGGLNVLLDENTIRNRVAELAHEIELDHKPGQTLVLIGVLKGAWVFLADLVRFFPSHRILVDFVQTSSYGLQTESAGKVEIIKDIRMDIQGLPVVLVEDILDTGLTLSHLSQIFCKRGALSVQVCTLLDKPSRRKVHLKADYVGFSIPDQFVVGYGMDAREEYRHLPFIACLSKDTQ